VLPPDPLQVVDLDHDQADDGDEDLRLAHGASFPDSAADRNIERVAAKSPAATRSESFSSTSGQYQ
jgi:hypothetical protein